MKNIFITGSTDGIGKLTAIKLAKDGHHIYLHGRNASKLENVIKEVKEASNNDAIEGFVSDFSDLSTVRSMVEEIKNNLSVLDVLVNNAGIFKSANPTNSKGMDVRFAVNYFAPYLLTNELIPLLKKSTSPRVVNLSSAAQSTVDLKALERGALPDQIAYAQSKLALTMWSMHLAEIEKDMITIAVNPGSLLNTKMVKEAYGQHWSSADKGRDILYELAISEEYADDNGKYFDNDKGMFSRAHDDAYDQGKIQALMDKTESILRNLY